ncbi:hypothetical protein ACFX15_046500 [Malus domestica]
MKEESSSETVTTAPKIQKLERLQTIEKEHKDALERAVSLNVPHAVTSNEEAPEDQKPEKAPEIENQSEDAADTKLKSTGGRARWDDLVEKLFKKESGDVLLTRDSNPPE